VPPAGARDEVSPAQRRLWLREGDDDRIQGKDPVLIVVTVKIVPFDPLGGLLERDDRLERGHLPERVRAFVEAVARHHDLAVSDRGASRAVERQCIRRFPEHPDHQVDAVDREGPAGRRVLSHVVLYITGRCPGGSGKCDRAQCPVPASGTWE